MGETVHFKCRVYPAHAPVTWFYRGQVIDSTADCKIQVGVLNDERTLSFVDCQVTDSGNVCARLNVNSKVSEATLKIEGKCFCE